MVGDSRLREAFCHGLGTPYTRRTETEEGKLSGAAEKGPGSSQMPDTRRPCLPDPEWETSVLLEAREWPWGKWPELDCAPRDRE